MNGNSLIVNTKLLTWLVLITVTCCCPQVSAQFTDAPQNKNVTEGEPLSINCTFTNPDRIFWRMGGTEIMPGNSNFDVRVIDSSSSMLTLSPQADHVTHTGAYQCVAVQGGSESVTDFSITVLYLSDVQLRFLPFQCITEGNPFIGSEVRMNCTAEGEPFPRVSWYRNEVPVQESTNIRFEQNNRLLIIANLTSTNSGNYHCQSENDALPAKTSDNMHLGFQTQLPGPGGTTLQVTNSDSQGNIFAPDGGLAMMDCQIYPPFPVVLSLTYRQGTGSIVSGVGDYIITNNDCNKFSLKINNFDMIKSGMYRCEHESNVASATLRIGMLIPINIYSSSEVIGIGREVRFTCNTTRTPGTNDISQSLTWQIGTDNGLVELKGERFVITSNTTAISTELVIRRAELTDTGTYFCSTFSPISNLLLPVMKSVDLSVESPPSITVTPSTPIVMVGGPLNLTCTLNTTRKSSFYWTVNGVNITSNSSYVVTESQLNQSLLRITALSLSDIGEIRCFGLDPLHLYVSVAATSVETTTPYIVGDGTGITMATAQINRTLELRCSLRGMISGSRTTQWFLGVRQLVHGSGNITISDQTDGTSVLTKSNVSLMDEAVYQCAVRLDGSSTALKLNYAVSVTIPPMFTKTPGESEEGPEGERFELTCEVSGRPVPKVNWFQLVTPVSELGDPSIRDHENGSLVFERLQFNHSGIYICKVVGFEAVSDRTELQVVVKENEFRVGSLNRSEAILVFTVVGLVAVLVLIATVMVIAVVISCYYMRRSPQGRYNVKNDSSDGTFKRQASLRDNSGIHSSPANHIFDTLQSPSSSTSAYKNPYTMGPSTAAIPLAMYRGPVPLNDRGAATNSMFSEAINSHTSTPIHGTMASTSLFGSEEQTSVTTHLPNYPRANLQLGDVMGEGEFGPVIMGVATNIVPGEERTLVAVKALLPHGEGGEDELNPEIALVDFANQMKLEFANIAVILGMCTDMEPYYVIYEYLDEGDLKKFLINSRPFDDDPPSLAPQHMRKIILQVADGMAYLFSQRIIHGDLATRNCLISSDLRVKIADLGIGHDLYNNDYYDNGSQLLPIRWMPPELLVATDEGPVFSLHSDIWSFGVFCWEVFSYSRLPYDSFTDEEVLGMVPAGTRLRSPSKTCPPALYDIMMDCWHEIPEERPVFAKLCVAIIGCELD